MGRIGSVGALAGREEALGRVMPWGAELHSATGQGHCCDAPLVPVRCTQHPVLRDLIRQKGMAPHPIYQPSPFSLQWRTLLNGHSSGSPTSPAITGFRWM